MARVSVAVVAVCLVAMIAIREAAATVSTCYQCTSCDGSEIADACGTGSATSYTHCFKTIIGTSVIRGCTAACVEKPGYNYCCDKDDCNGAGSVRFGALSLITAIVAKYVAAAF